MKCGSPWIPEMQSAFCLHLHWDVEQIPPFQCIQNLTHGFPTLPNSAHTQQILSCMHTYHCPYFMTSTLSFWFSFISDHTFNNEQNHLASPSKSTPSPTSLLLPPTLVYPQWPSIDKIKLAYCTLQNPQGLLTHTEGSIQNDSPALQVPLCCSSYSPHTEAVHSLFPLSGTFSTQIAALLFAT